MNVEDRYEGILNKLQQGRSPRSTRKEKYRMLKKTEFFWSFKKKRSTTVDKMRCLLLLLWLSAVRSRRLQIVESEAAVVGGRCVHLVMTRYNVGQSEFPNLSLARKQQFEAISRPSLEGQSDRRFFWLLTVDASLVKKLERERKKRGDDWYAFVAVDGVEHHLEYVPLVYLDMVFDGNWSHFVKTERIDHLVTTHLDVDDALPRDYAEKTTRWYAENVHLYRERFFGACADKEVDWIPDENSPNGRTKNSSNLSWPDGCLASGLVIARPAASTLIERPCPICRRHTHMRSARSPLTLWEDTSIFRVRSISSAGARHLHLDDADDDATYVPSNLTALDDIYNIQDLQSLNRHLIDESKAIANEMLDASGDAAGCNPAFSFSDNICGRSVQASKQFLGHHNNDTTDNNIIRTTTLAAAAQQQQKATKTEPTPPPIFNHLT